MTYTKFYYIELYCVQITYFQKKSRHLYCGVCFLVWVHKVSLSAVKPTIVNRSFNQLRQSDLNVKWANTGVLFSKYFFACIQS